MKHGARMVPSLIMPVVVLTDVLSLVMGCGGTDNREVAAPGETPPPAATEAVPTALPNTSTPSPPKPTRQQEPDRPQVLRWEGGKTTEDLEEGQWYLAEIDEDGLQGKSFVMVTPYDRLTASYQCLVAGEGGIGSGPVVSIDYPERLPGNLAERGVMVPVETVMNGEVLPVGWHRKYPSDRGIFLGGEDAQMLVRRIWETDAVSYRLRFPDHPELVRAVPSAGLGEIAGEVIAKCESWDYGSSAVGELSPPQVVQEPVDGQYAYTAPGGRFTLRYPADCGQMWEAPGLANNADRCPAGEPAIRTSVEWYSIPFAERNAGSLDQLAGVYADGVATIAKEEGALVSRYTLKTEAGHVLEIVDSEWELEEGDEVLQIAFFMDVDFWMIAVYMGYPADGAHLHRERVLDAFKTFTAGEPAK